MGLLKEINDTVWKFLLDLLKPLSDNVAIDILAISILYMIVIMWIRIKRMKLHVFNITDFIFVTSVGYMVERLPMIHKRIHLALTTVTKIISSSSIYSDAFTHVTNIPVSNTPKVARYLYFLNDHGKLQYTEPMCCNDSYNTINMYYDQELPFKKAFSCVGKTAIYCAMYQILDGNPDYSIYLNIYNVDTGKLVVGGNLMNEEVSYTDEDWEKTF